MGTLEIISVIGNVVLIILLASCACSESCKTDDLNQTRRERDDWRERYWKVKRSLRKINEVINGKKPKE